MLKSQAIISLSVITGISITVAFLFAVVSVNLFDSNIANASDLPHDVSLYFITSGDSVLCRQALPLMNEFSRNGYKIHQISAEQNPNIIKQFNVTIFPSFILLRGERIVDRVDGGSAPVVLKPMIQGMFDRAEASAGKNIAKNRSNLPESDSGKFAPRQSDSKTPPSTVPFEQTSFITNKAADSLTEQNLSNDISRAVSRDVGRELLMASVKLRVDSSGGHSWGTGTIIDSRSGAALILTCGHIFRESGKSGEIEVHLYGENSSVKVYGRCIYFDLEIDLGLVVILPPCPVRVVPVASDSSLIVSGQKVFSVGCDGGAAPSLRDHTIMSIDRISTPSANKLPFNYIQVSGAPVGGRSGGGLFCGNDSRLIGVCNTADPVQDDGHFVPAHIIRQVLDQHKLSIVYQKPSLKSTTKNESVTNNTANNTANNFEPIHSNITPPITPPATAIPPANNNAIPIPHNHNHSDKSSLTTESKLTSTSANSSTNLPESQRTNSQNQNKTKAQNQSSDIGVLDLSPVEFATMSEVKRRVQDGDEVILIVRSRRNPEIPSDVIVLSDASEQFIETLIRQTTTTTPKNISTTDNSDKSPINPVILSSHDIPPKTSTPTTPNQPHLQPVSFTISH
jgi:hypothetical protein